MRGFIRRTLGWVVVSGLVLLSGCGSNDDTPAPPAPLETGRLVGNLIEQVPFECGSEKGKTGRLGQFRYRAGDACAFKLGKMVFPVTSAKLQKGYVTAYDLTATETEAWTLMAILESISHWRPGNNLMVVDGNLESRVPPVKLGDGDAAVAAALAPFKGTVKAVSVSNARILLAQTVNRDNSLLIPLASLVAQGKANLDGLQIAVESGVPYLGIGGSSAQSKEEDHSNKVNLRFYDYEGNPLNFNFSAGNAFSSTPSYLPYQTITNATSPQLDSVWVTSGQNPSDNRPSFGQTSGTTQGSNIVGYDLDVGRKDSDWVGSGFQNAAFWPGSSTSQPSPITILAAGAHPSANENTAYPEQLNFAFSVNMQGVFSNQKTFSCNNLMFGQSTTTTSLKAVFDFLYNLGETVMQGVELLGTDGIDIEADYDFMGSVKSTVKDSLKLGNQNWWIFGVNAQTASYRVTIKGNPAVMMPCTDNTGTIIPAVINSTADDHTFDVHLAFPGQKLQAIGAATCTGCQ